MSTEDPLLDHAQTITDIRVQLGVLNNTSRHHERLINTLTEGIGKIEEVNHSLLKLLTLHDHKHTLHEESDSEFEKDLDQLDRDIDELKAEFHHRITASTTETRDKIDEVKTEIHMRFDVMRKEIMEIMEVMIPKNDDQNKTFKEFERWKWMLMGGVLFVLWLVDKWEFLIRLVTPTPH